MLERRVALLDLLRAALSERDVLVRIGSENELPALQSLALVAAGYGLPSRKLGTVSLIGPVRMDYAGAIRTVREAALPALAVHRRRLRGMTATMATAPRPLRGPRRRARRRRDHRSRRRSASSPASCTPTSTATTPTPRRSSRRPPRPTRSSTTPSAGRPTTATATTACAPAASRPNFEGFGSISDLFDAFFGGGGRRRLRRRARRRGRPQGRDIAVDADITLAAGGAPAPRSS